jgi:SpoU rRNA methylase family enzyme
MKLFLASAVILITATGSAFAGENLRLNPKLDYTNDSQNGPLITGDRMEDAVAVGKPAYVFMYGEGCFNSKRQARRTVSLYEKYKGQVQFVIIDLDHSLSPAQQELRKKYYKGYIPHVVVLDSSGAALYNSAGEVDESVIAPLLDKASR